MVTGSRIEGGAAAAGVGGTRFISARVRKTIQSIKEIVGNHSDADIYVTLKETNMDPNETAQKLLNQDPFHEVKRKKDKKKEITGYKGSFSVEPRKPTDQPRRPTEHVGQVVKFNTYSDRNVRRRGFIRNTVQDAGPTREFRVVRDNRTNQNADREMKPPLAPSSDLNSNVSEKSSSAGISNNQKQPVGRHSSQHVNGPTDSRPRQARENSAIGTDLKDTSAERQPLVSNAAPTVQAGKANGTQITSLNNSVVGVYSSSSDPVHVPSLDARPAANVGAIKREVGAVGARRQASENSSKLTTSQTSSFANTQLGRDGPSRDTFRSFPAMSKSDQPAQTNATESAVPSMSVGRSFLNNQHSNRSHQQVVAHQKAAQPNKEWKPKSSQKPSVIGPGVIGTPTKSVPLAAHNSKNLGTEADQLQDKLSRANIHEKQNVIIAEHIRVSETDRCRLTFGSLGTEVGSSRSAGFEAIGGADESVFEPSASVSPSARESSSDETSGSKQVESLDDRVRSSGSISPTSAGASEHQMKDRRESPSPQNLESYADIGLVRGNSPSYTPSEQQQQQQDPPGLQHFSAYDSQASYDIPYFRSAVDESGRGQVLPIPHEVLSSHAANSIPASTIAMVQQQQAPVAQMYPQVHFANLMTYPHRQFLSPVYVPPIAMPGYTNNPTYSPHPSNGSSYLLMPGANSPHLTANGLKYGIQQFKPIPAGSATGFGTFSSPAGYAMNAPGGVGGAAGLDDSSRLKYKDGNLYVPNPQAETSELWMNSRDIPNMQSASYYNMTAQTPHAAYMPSHTSHASFNAAPQSSHMQFPGMYHPPPQPAAIANPHHMGGPMGGNVGVGVAAGAPGAQVGGYQQPQMGHMNWSGNF